MLVNLQEVLAIAERDQIAIGAFNVCNWESGRSIISAAEKCNRPVIIQYADGHAPFMSLEESGYIMLDLAKRAKVPVCVNLDHGESFERCMTAIKLGFTSVMIDASAKEYEENVAETKAVVRAAHAFNVGVEAELGHILSHENGVSDDNIDKEKMYTNPEVAKDFIEKTGVDALAISFGTAHGLYLKKPILDLDRIKDLRIAKKIPYVMHGGSGLSKQEFQTAIKNGIRKINYYTYMSLAAGKAVKDAMDNVKSGEKVYYHDIPLIAEKATEENIIETIKIFSHEI